MISEVTQTDLEDVAYFRIQEQEFEDESFATYIERKKLESVKETKDLVKAIRKYSQEKKCPIEPLATILLLDSTEVVVINKYIRFGSSLMAELN